MTMKIVSIVGFFSGAADPMLTLEFLENWGRVNAHDVPTDNMISATEMMEKICKNRHG